VLSAGFGVLVASSLEPNHNLGLLLAGATLTCYAATLLLLPLLLRLGIRAGATAAACLLFAGAVAPLAGAADLPCAGAPDPDATALMVRVERARRGQPRIVRMQIETVYPEGSRLASHLGAGLAPKTLWGAVSGDPDESWLLFVFSGPGRMAGTALLIQDFFASDERDATWLYLRAFDSFRRLEGRFERTVVPGSALTYEDAREYVANEKYFYRSGDKLESHAARVVACPKTPELADRLGYGALLLDVDTERLIVERIEYRGLGGGVLKRYELIEAGSLEGRALPRRVKLVNVVDGFENQIAYEYWPSPGGLPAELFEPDVARGSFLSRLRGLLHERGLGDRIEAEIDAAEVSVSAYDQRVRAAPERDPP
jgi:hypothetical protein